ncbi:MAG: hypothetical protein JWQ98_1921 [Chlorobi bacterium]|nr:hypothetical protein [Chlorobiota bacterium]
MIDTGKGSDIFWGEIAPCEHMVQIYADNSVLLDSLEGFAGAGIEAGEGVIVIATEMHRNGLESRLRARGVDVDAARARDQYIDLDAADVLPRFMVRGWPDEQLFISTIMSILERARGNGRRVRAFGEMVAILWGRGEQGATVRMEYLWHRLCETETFSLFCAYPRVGFTQHIEASIDVICSAHSRVIAGN